MDLLKDLNPEQKKAAEHDQGPLLIVAGAGTGKTTVVTRKIAYLISEKQIPADEILALTFTDKAAGEMEERVEALLPFGYFDMWISTFHSFGEKILKQHALDIGLPNNFKLLSETEQWLLMRQHLDELELDYYKPKGNPTKFLQALITHFSRLKDEDITPEQYLEYAENLKLDKDIAESGVSEKDRISELANAYHTYQKLLLDNSALDFGDLITYTIKLFKERPAILKKYQEQFKYILVDEFQDTNYAQYDLIKLLAANKNLTVVGDDDQSVYKFRGASVSNIMQFKDDYPKTKEIVLTENYRSCQPILDLAYNFIQKNNPDRLEEKLKINKNLASKYHEPPGECSIEHLHFNTKESEAAGLVKKIIELKTEKDSWKDFAILVRANNQADLFTPYLERAKVPYQFMASKGLFGKPIILDLLAYLRLLDNYHESRAVYRVLNLDIFNLTHEEIMDLLNTSKKKNISLFEAMRLKPDPKTEKILTLISKHTQLVKNKSVGEILLQFLEDSGYLKDITRVDDQKSRENVLYLNQFYKFIEKFAQATDDPSVKNFIEEINLISEAGDQGSLKPDFEEGPDTVKIMTVHSAKGLEFKHVFIVNLVDKRFPSIKRSDPIQIPENLIKETLPEGDAHLQEERRLFYVACTRAKQGLYFTTAEDYGGARKKKFSRFLVEADIVKDPAPAPTGEVDFNKTKPVKKDVRTADLQSVPKRFSFTQLKAFETCPWQYRFAHILKIPVPGKASFSFGKSMHEALYKFFTLLQQQNQNKQESLFESSVKTKHASSPDLKVLLDLYEESWISEWYYSKKNEEEYKKKGREALKEFYKLHESNWPKVEYLEKAFNLKIKDYTLKGAIDRIDHNEEGLEIIDYKTGKFPASRRQATASRGGPKRKKDKEQLLLYALAVREVFKEKATKLTYYYIEENKSLSFDIKDEDYVKTEEWVLDKINAILKSDFTATPGFHCQYCDFASICEHKK